MTLFSIFILKKEVNCEDAIYVGLSPDYPPFSFIDNNIMKGFDIDLLEEIGARLNKKVFFKIIPFDSLLPSIQVGSVDVIASGLSASPNRLAVVFMSLPYLNDSLVEIRMKNNDCQKEKKINAVVNIGYTAEKYVTERMSNLFTNVLKVKSFADALLFLKISKADVFITAKNSFQILSDEFVVKDIESSKNYESLVFYINKEKKSLLIEINQLIDELIDEGFIQILEKKWGMR